jgi:hypothetical protein
MSKRIDKSWRVFISIENFEHDRCVDLFSRPDGTCGFEEFRHDPEDSGAWTPVSFYSGSIYASREAAFAAALQSVTWLQEAIAHSPSAQRAAVANLKPRRDLKFTDLLTAIGGDEQIRLPKGDKRLSRLSGGYPGRLIKHCPVMHRHRGVNHRL